MPTQLPSLDAPFLDAELGHPPRPDALTEAGTVAGVAMARGLLWAFGRPLGWLALACLVVALGFLNSGMPWDAAEAFGYGFVCAGARLGLEALARRGPCTLHGSGSN